MAMFRETCSKIKVNYCEVCLETITPLARIAWANCSDFRLLILHTHVPLLFHHLSVLSLWEHLSTMLSSSRRCMWEDTSIFIFYDSLNSSRATQCRFPSAMSLSQTTLAAAILLSTSSTYIAMRPPNPGSEIHDDSISDWVRRIGLTGKHAAKFTLAPLVLIALHQSSLAYWNPEIPAAILRYGAQNGLNKDLISWSTATYVPISLIICIGAPLRLVSYSSLGRNFTFALKRPDHLMTSGIYRYVQHPSYTGLVIMALSNIMLLCRIDGVLSCWIHPSWYGFWKTMWWAHAPFGLGMFLLGVWKRVQQEERVLRGTFGVEWEKWHSGTARFLPGIF